WDEVSDLQEDGGSLPPRIEPRTSSKKRKVRASKRRGEESDWPYYAIGLIGFGPLFIVQLLVTYALLSNPSLAVRRAQAQAVVPGANANEAFGGAAPAGVAVGGPFAPQVAGGQIANNGAHQPPGNGGALGADSDEGNGLPATEVQRRSIPAARPNPEPNVVARLPQAMPPAFPPARPFPILGHHPFAGGTNRAAEIQRQHDEWRKAALERANAARQRMQADMAAQGQAVTGAGQPLIVEEAAPNHPDRPIKADPPAKLGQAAPNFAANPAQGANRQAVNPAPAFQAAAPAAAAEDVEPIGGLDPYVSREGQRALSIILPLWHLAMLVYLVEGMWATFAKAGRPGWAVLIPIYNGVVLFNIAEVSLWWLPTLLIPGFGLIPALVLTVNLAAKFGKGNAFGVGLALLGPIFYPVLGFGNARYQPRQTRFASDSY
ncbi:MAG TPA: DUF5684 domain-containing protein, partial [Planctomycetaceae bacterium]|nr:DUF5684 domain-containing protein [Planctomycetaceae bacterium]